VFKILQRGNGCRFFVWCDPPMCERSMEIIPGLLKQINSLIEDLHKAKELNNTNLMKIEKLEDQILSKDVRLARLEERNMTRKNMIAELHELHQKKGRRRLSYLGLTWLFCCCGFSDDVSENK
jgi:hypothetical protein